MGISDGGRFCVHLWSLIICVNLTWPRDVKYLVNHLLWVCLWGCFWMRLAFELVDWIAQITLPNVGGPQLISRSLIFFFKFFFFFFNWLEANYFTTFPWVLSYIDMNQPWSYMYSPSRSPLHLPLHLIPLGLPSAPGLSTCLTHPTWAGDLLHYR